MDDLIFSAEIKPLPGKTREAGIRLKELGFRVHRVETYISVDAPQTVWWSVFKIDFTFPKESVGNPASFPSSRSKFEFPDKVNIPENLQNLILEVLLVRPPELF